MSMRFSRPVLSPPIWALACVLGLAALPGCGGGGESSAAPAASSHGPTAPPPAQAGSFSPGPGPSGGGGGGGFVGGGGGGGGYSGGGGGHPRVGGMAGQLYRQAQLRQARIERAHRGPQRLTGLSDEAQRAADLAQAGRTRVPHYSTDDDTCERAWAQGSATDTAYRAIRGDGIAPATGPADERRFLAYCRAQPADQQQCWDADYRRAHAETCAQSTQARQTEGRQRQQAIDRAAARARPHGT